MAVVQAGCYQRWYAGDVCDSQAETGSYEDVCFRSATVWPVATGWVLGALVVLGGSIEGRAQPESEPRPGHPR